MDNIKHLFYDYLISIGTNGTTAKYLNMFVLLVALLIVVFIVDWIIRKLLIQVFTKFAARSKTNFDDFLIANKAPRNVAHIIPLLLALELVPTVFYDFSNVENFVEKGLKVFAVILTLWIARSLLNTLRDYLKTLPRLKDKPIDSYIQVFMIFAWIAGILSIIVIVTNTSFFAFLTSFPASRLSFTQRIILLLLIFGVSP